MSSRRRTGSNPATVARLIIAVLVIAGLAVLVWVLLAMYRMFAADSDRGGEVRIPNLLKLQQAEAVQLLESSGLKVEVKTGSSETAQPGEVYLQNPKPGHHRRPGSTVVIFVSQGKVRYVVPPLTGKHVDDASRELIAAGFLLGSIRKVYDPALPPGQIVSQMPQAGQEFLSPPTVDMLVSDSAQPEIGPMPNLVGQDLAGAERLLARSGLQVLRVTHKVADDVSPGTVIKQSIAAETPVKLGQRVDLEVSMARADLNKLYKQLKVEVTIPEGPAKQQVQIKVVDKVGSEIVCDETKAPGDVVSRIVDVEGAAEIQLYLRGSKTAWRIDVIPYEAPPAWTPPAEEASSPAPAAPPPGATF